mgnify:CR=1 FL=1
MNKNIIIPFCQALGGHYSNFEQSQIEPNKFAHINIYFQPIPWNVFEGPGFYSEQSYDITPWSPYRQAIHRLIESDKRIIFENYKLNNAIRFAGGGFMPKLLSEIKRSNLFHINGCAMHFININQLNFRGNVEPGNKCIINRSGVNTCLSGYVEFNPFSWQSLDEGFDINTNKKIWASENGPMKFTKISSIPKIIYEKWVL